MSSMTSSTPRPRIALTLGDPSGIGPELAAKLVADPSNRARADILVLASGEELDTAAAEAGVEILHAGTAGPDAVAAVGSSLSGAPVERGRVSVEGGRRAMTDLESALDMHERGDVDAIVFTPLNKAALAMAGMAHEDELRWFAQRLGYRGTTSELNLVPGLTTSRVTSHIPVSEVASCISAHRVAEAARLLNTVVLAQGVERPRLAVCALNPHAGEGGKFGREEIDHIAPAVALLQSEGVDAQGPFPCDTLFIRAREGEFDGVVTMYHDQGQIAMKLMGFDQGVTVQGGLPVPIATPAHGTAYGIVGKGVASTGPTQRAFDVALELAERELARRS